MLQEEINSCCRSLNSMEACTQSREDRAQLPQLNADWYNSDLFWLHFQAGLFDADSWGRAQSEAMDVITALNLKAGKKVLDLCCGPGRHILPLALAGIDVTGVDRTQAYLDMAANRLSEVSSPARLIASDMREYMSPDEFDAVISMCNSFGYFNDIADDRRVLENIYKSLKTSGQLLLDISSKEAVARNFLPEWSSRQGDIEITVTETIMADWTWRQMHWRLCSPSKTFEYTAGHRLYSAVELRTLLASSGFSRVTFSNNIIPGPYDQWTKRMVAIAVK